MNYSGIIERGMVKKVAHGIFDLFPSPPLYNSFYRKKACISYNYFFNLAENENFFQLKKVLLPEDDLYDDQNAKLYYYYKNELVNIFTPYKNSRLSVTRHEPSAGPRTVSNTSPTCRIWVTPSRTTRGGGTILLKCGERN